MERAARTAGLKDPSRSWDLKGVDFTAAFIAFLPIISHVRFPLIRLSGRGFSASALAYLAERDPRGTGRHPAVFVERLVVPQRDPDPHQPLVHPDAVPSLRQLAGLARLPALEFVDHLRRAIRRP